MSEFENWTTIARNLPEHARNAIHTDAGAQAAGFPRALVAGVTTYAYLTHPVVAAFGKKWLESGSCEIRLRRPVFDGDDVLCEVGDTDGRHVVRAITSEPEQPRAILTILPNDAPVPLEPIGEQLKSRNYELVGEWGCDYGMRVGDPLELYQRERIVHPAVWPVIANDIVHNTIARGSWIHVRSIIRHHQLVQHGELATVHSVVTNRSSDRGHRAIVDIRIMVAGKVAVSIEHEAIIDVTTPHP